MAEKVRIDDCLSIKKSGLDIRWELSEKCPKDILEIIKMTAGEGGETIYSIEKPKTPVDQCDVVAETRCALDADKEKCIEEEREKCEKGD